MTEAEMWRFLAQFPAAREEVKTWPQWMQDAARTAAATFPRASVSQQHKRDKRMAGESPQE